MTNIIIDHQSTFTAYILALSIYFKYLHLRNLKIMIIENEISQSLDTKPWCGISTLNNFKLSNQDFINYLIQFYYYIREYIDSTSFTKSRYANKRNHEYYY